MRQESLAEAKISTRQQCLHVCLQFNRYCLSHLQITRNKQFKVIQGHSIDHSANRMRICNFLLVINSNFTRISYRIRDDALHKARRR